MMRVRFAVMALSLAVFACGSTKAQDFADRVSFNYALTPSPHMTITNIDESRITAIAAIVTDSSGRKRETVWFDSAINFDHDKPIERYDAKSFPIGGGSSAEVPSFQAKLMAVMFEDGNSAGDPLWVGKIQARRNAVYDEIPSITAVLNQAFSQREANDAIVAQLDGMRASLRTSVADTDVRSAASFAFEYTIISLKETSVGGVIGDPQKTIPVLMPSFTEWQMALRRFDSALS